MNTASTALAASENPQLELVCPAGSLPALKAAIDNGADSVYLGFRDATNARNFAGLNFDARAIAQGIDYAHQRGRKILLALNTYPQPNAWQQWRDAIDRAAEANVDAVIVADPGLMAYASQQHPNLRLHLSVQGSATNPEAIKYYYENFGVQRVVLPRVLSLTQVEQVCEQVPVQVEVFGFGSLCVMVEGRCALSSYATGESPNTHGVCSPAGHVRWEQTEQGLESRLNGVLIDRYQDGENAAYPTLCKGRFDVAGIKIEGRQRSPAYVAQVTQVWRQAIDLAKSTQARYSVHPAWMGALNKLAEGQQHTLGAYSRPWK